MANKAISATFFLVFFLVAISGVASLCEKPSGTWSGYCLKTGDCDKQCQNWESAVHGACHWRGITQMCFCYYNTCPSAEMHAKFISDAKKAHQARDAAASKPQTKN